MPTSFQDSLSHLTTRMVDLLWHQWSSIGVAGYPRPGDDWIIDPEALLLATTRFGRHDSRLMDESIDWLAKFGRRISLQRLQGLHRSWPGVADPRALAALAEVLGQQVAHRKWRVIADPAPEVSPAESFFFRSDGTPGILIGEAEAIFAKHGLLRGKLDLRGMSQPPNPRTRENLIFTLRALLGVNARAEILAWLLTHDSGHPAAIARSTGYFSKSIQQILNEMEESAQVISWHCPASTTNPSTSKPSNSARHSMKPCLLSSVPASSTNSAAPAINAARTSSNPCSPISIPSSANRPPCPSSPSTPRSKPNTPPPGRSRWIGGGVR